MSFTVSQRPDKSLYLELSKEEILLTSTDKLLEEESLALQKEGAEWKLSLSWSDDIKGALLFLSCSFPDEVTPADEWAADIRLRSSKESWDYL